MRYEIASIDAVLSRAVLVRVRSSAWMHAAGSVGRVTDIPARTAYGRGIRRAWDARSEEE